MATTIRIVCGMALGAGIAGLACARPQGAPSHIMRSMPTSPPTILEPAQGAVAPIGRLRLRIGGSLGPASEAEVELDQHHRPGVLDTAVTWRAPASALEAGIWLPPEASAREVGDFSLLVRIVAPYTGPQSAAVAVRLTPPRQPSQDRYFDGAPPPPTEQDTRPR